jgi:hypothetical protein
MAGRIYFAGSHRVLNTAADHPDARNLDKQVQQFLDKLKSTDRVPQDITIEHFRRIMDVMAVNGRDLNGYSPKPYQGDVLLVTSTLDEKEDPTLDWSQLVRDKLNVQVIPGKHGECILHPGVVTLSEIMRNEMNRAQMPDRKNQLLMARG